MTANIWNPGSTVIQKVDAENSFKSQSFVTTSHQTLFTLTEFAYVINTGSIAIWRNGQKLLKDVDYIEVSDSTFSLLVDVVAGEKIEAVAIIGSTLANTTLAQQAAADALAYKNAAATSESNAAASAGQASTDADIAEAAKVFVVSGIASATYAAPLKSNLVNTDRFPLVNSEASNTLAGATLGDIKSVFKTFYDPATSVLSNKTFNLSNNSLLGTIAQFNAACLDADFVSTDGAATLSNKTLNLNTNTLSGTLAQFNSACTDADFVSLAGAETLTNKTLTTPVINGATGSTAAWNIGNGQFVKDASGNITFGASGSNVSAEELRLNTQSYLRVGVNIGSGMGWGGGYNSYYSGGWKHANTGPATVISHNSDGSVRVATGASQSAGTALVDRVTIDSSGNVGIGNSTDNNTRRLAFTTVSGGTAAIESVTVGAINQALVFKTTFGTEAERMRIDGQGVVTCYNGIKPSSSSDVLSIYDEAYTVTLTATGFTTTPTASADFVRNGKLVTMSLPYISGTSNATTFTLTGVPENFRPSIQRIVLGVTVNNGTMWALSRIYIETSGVITITSDTYGSAFTASGNKNLLSTNISYLI